jgi:membrane-associated phospholipid phosphatase
MESTPAVKTASLPIVPSLTFSPAARSFSRELWVAAVAVLIGLALFQWVDVPAANWLAGSPIPRDIQKVLEAAEHFGTFYGEVLILAVLYCAVPADRRRLPRVAAVAWFAGIFADLLKLFIARCRPKYFDFDAVTSAHGFLDVFAFGAGGSRHQGFPSAHTATAVGFCFALSRLYPRGRFAFGALALLVGLQRLESQSHFASDVIAGAIVGWCVGRWATGNTRVAQRFDRFEAAVP